MHSSFRKSPTKRLLSQTIDTSEILSCSYMSPRVVAKNYTSPRCNLPKYYQARGNSPLSLRNSSPVSRLSYRMPSPKRPCYHHSKKLSAYEKIKSSRSLKNIMLPSFVRITDSDIKEYNNSQYLNRTDIVFNDTTLIKSSKQSPNINKIIPKTHPEIHQLIFDSTKLSDDILLTYGKIQLTRADLKNFQPNKMFTSDLIDACLKCIKKKNSILRKKGKIKESAYFLSIKFCKNLFVNKILKPNPFKKNLLKYR